jgi:hypothetical protein
MAVQLSIDYEQVVALVEQLSPEQQTDLLTRLLEKSKMRQLTSQERKALLESITIDLGAVLPGYSDRREDWYGDDGR